MMMLRQNSMVMINIQVITSNVAISAQTGVTT